MTLLFLLLWKTCDAAFFSKQTAKIDKRIFARVPEATAHFVNLQFSFTSHKCLLDLLGCFFFKVFSSVSNLLGYPRSLFILLDKLEALGQESDHLDETRAVLCELGIDTKPQFDVYKMGITKFILCLKN